MADSLMALPLFVASHRFDPRSIPGLESWWDAADAASVTLDSGRVSQLADKSGKGRHAANTTSGSTQPSYVTGARNGLNVARFAAASVQRLTVASSTATYNFLHDGTPSWFAAVNTYGTVADPNALYGLFGNNNTGTASVGVECSYDDRAAVPVNNSIRITVANGSIGSPSANPFNAGNSAILSDYNNVFTADTLHVQECALRANDATASNRMAVRVNGGTERAANNKTTAASTSNATNNFQLGCTGNNAFPLQGDICEVLIFSQIPTAAARDMIRRYLGQKWGVSVA
jgi:hypothetical protein